MVPRSTHETFAKKLYQTLKNHMCMLVMSLIKLICSWTITTTMLLQNIRQFILLGRHKKNCTAQVFLFKMVYEGWLLVVSYTLGSRPKQLLSFRATARNTWLNIIL